MKKLSANGLRWLKSLHLLAVSCWIGGAISLLLLYFLKTAVNDAGVLYGINQSIHHVDINVVVIPGAIGCFVTGLIYSLFSNWGFFKHHWLTFKWGVTVLAILFGTFYLGPWETEMMNISGKLGLAALSDPDYLASQKLNLWFGAAQTGLLLVTLVISIFKPWGRNRQRAG